MLDPREHRKTAFGGYPPSLERLYERFDAVASSITTTRTVRSWARLRSSGSARSGRSCSAPAQP